MAYYHVSDENLNKVESFFIKKVNETGTTRIEATVVDIADGSGVALATAHKAIKELVQSKRVQMIKPSSRRFPITYIYHGDVGQFELDESKDAQIQFLLSLNKELQEQILQLKNGNNKAVLEQAFSLMA